MRGGNNCQDYQLRALVTKLLLYLSKTPVPSVRLAGAKLDRGDQKAPPRLGEVEGALFQPLFGLVEFLLYVTLTVALAWCRHPGSRVQWTRSWEVLVELGVAELGMMELVLGVGGKVLKTTTEHDRLVGGNHPGLQSINSFDQLPHVLVEI